jgi:hypothetical protein
MERRQEHVRRKTLHFAFKKYVEVSIRMSTTQGREKEKYGHGSRGARNYE